MKAAILVISVLVGSAVASVVIPHPGGLDPVRPSPADSQYAPNERDSYVYRGSNSGYDPHTSDDRNIAYVPTSYGNDNHRNGYEAPASSGLGLYGGGGSSKSDDHNDGYEPAPHRNEDDNSGYRPSGYQPNDYRGTYNPTGYQPNGNDYRGGYNGGYNQPTYNSYNPHSSHGGYAPPPHAPRAAPAPVQAEVDLLDLLFAKADAAKDKLNTLREQLGAQEARQSLQKKVYDRLMILGDLQNTDILNGEKIDLQEYAVRQLELSVDALAEDLSKVVPVNEQNLQAQESNQNAMTREAAVDIRQDVMILENTLFAKGIAARLENVLGNGGALFEAGVAITSTRADGITKTCQRKMCEVGEVTLTQGDQVAEYAFQTVFPSVPQVMYSVQGIDMGFTAGAPHRRTQPVSPRFNYASGYDQGYRGGNGYNDQGYRGGNGYNGYDASYNNGGGHAGEPRSLGFRINAYPTLDSLIVEVNGLLAFGDDEVSALTVSFQACSIGPGIGPLNH